MFEFIPNLFVCESNFPFFLYTMYKSEFIEKPAPSVWLLSLYVLHCLAFVFPHLTTGPWCWCCIVVLICWGVCIHSELHTFPVNIQDWIHPQKKKKLQLLRPVEQNRPLPCLNISQLQHCLFQIPKYMLAIRTKLIATQSFNRLKPKSKLI